jgi:hypothetical protein
VHWFLVQEAQEDDSDPPALGVMTVLMLALVSVVRCLAGGAGGRFLVPFQDELCGEVDRPDGDDDDQEFGGVDQDAEQVPGYYKHDGGDYRGRGGVDGRVRDLGNG